MCGIDGLVNFHNPAPLDGYYAAHLSLRHRGLDDEGFFALTQGAAAFYRGDETISAFDALPHIRSLSAAHLLLGFRRLAIIDLSPGGHQPMLDASGRFALAFNGEIYNYLELRQELAALGHVFASQSDSEVLLAAYAQWGSAAFNRFNGMWALAIFDMLKQQLILSRDRFGVKPLYYTQQGDTLYFASEARFLLPFLPAVQMHAGRAQDFLVHNWIDHHPETMFAGVFQLMPAHYAVFDSDGFRAQAYWELPSRRQRLSLPEAAQQLEALLTSAVALRLRSDVPIGSLLSGGLDSTTIVCLVRRLLDARGAANDFDFFTADFHEPAFSERGYVEQTVAQTGMRIHWVYPQPGDIRERLPALLRTQEFPFRSLAVYSQWALMRRVAETPIKVLLDGQGSDEIFAGYSAHYYALIAEYLRRLRPDRAWASARALAAAREIGLLQGFAGALRELVKASPLRALAQQRAVPYLQAPYREQEGWRRRSDLLENALARNLTFSALPEYLRYEDRNSMAFTLESRLPFMDYRLVEWAMALPAELKIDGVTSKRVLRAMSRPLIPAAIAARRDKMGFVSPQENWQRGALASLIDDAFSGDGLERLPFLNASACRQRYATYRSGQNNDWAWVWRVACLVWWRQTWWS